MDAANREAEAARARLEKIKGAQGSAEPKAGDFEDHLEYVAAKAVWQASQGAQKQRVEDVQAEIQSAEQAAAQAANAAREARIEQLSETVPDIREKIAVAVQADVVISREVAALVYKHDKSAELLYHLGSNPEELRLTA